VIALIFFFFEGIAPRSTPGVELLLACSDWSHWKNAVAFFGAVLDHLAPLKKG
jgi:hypothetical protein